MSPKPKVGIVFSSYHNARLAQACLEHCLQQSYPCIEIVIADDGSTDDTLHRLQNIAKKHPHVEVLALCHTERGLARKQAIDSILEKQIDYLYILDSDMLPEKDLVKSCVTYLQKHSEIGALVIPEKPFSNFTNFYSKVKVFERSIINNAGDTMDTSSIEAARFWTVDAYKKSGGIHPAQISFEETQPTIRYMESGGCIKRAIFTGARHDEKEVTLKNILQKKYYYFKEMDKTFHTEKNGTCKALRRWYFFRKVLYRKENIKLYIRHPLLSGGIFFMYLCLTGLAILAFCKKLLMHIGRCQKCNNNS